MGMLLVYLFFIVVVFILIILASVVSFSIVGDEEKLSPFECGFISFQGARLFFSLQFFLVAIVFLVFDVEIALILPLPLVVMAAGGKSVMVVFSIFMIVVLGGLYYEWGSGVLDWGY